MQVRLRALTRALVQISELKCTYVHVCGRECT